MNKFEYGQESDENEEKFDPTDSWDIHLVNVAKSLRMDQEVKKDMADKELFSLGIDFVAGRQYDDGFGAWEPGKGNWTVEKPEKISGFDDNLVNGKYRVQIHFVAVGQPDGPGTPGHVWAARLWDRKEDKEIPDSRVFATKLSHAATAALLHMPSWGHDEWRPNRTEKEQRVRKDWERQIQEGASALDHHWLVAEKSPWKDKLRGIMSKEFILFETMLSAGGAKQWIEKNINPDISLHELVDFNREIEQMCSIAFDLNEYFKNPDQFKKNYPNSPIFQIIEDEGDGWMPPPQWKG